MSEVPNSRQTMHVCDCKATMKFEDIGLPIITSPPVGGTEYCDERVYRPMYVRAHTYLTNHHWRQPRRGCRGHTPPNILVGERQPEYPLRILLRTFGYSRPILVALRSLNLKPVWGGMFPSHTPPHSVVRPPNLELALTPLRTTCPNFSIICCAYY